MRVSPGLRHVLVVLDATGQPISASDHVLYWSKVSRIDQNADTVLGSALHAEFCQESIGGRFESDGTFRGTRWQTVRRGLSLMEVSLKWTPRHLNRVKRILPALRRLSQK